MEFNEQSDSSDSLHDVLRKFDQICKRAENEMGHHQRRLFPTDRKIQLRPSIVERAIKKPVITSTPMPDKSKRLNFSSDNGNFSPILLEQETNDQRHSIINRSLMSPSPGHQTDAGLPQTEENIISNVHLTNDGKLGQIVDKLHTKAKAKLSCLSDDENIDKTIRNKSRNNTRITKNMAVNVSTQTVRSAATQTTSKRDSETSNSSSSELVKLSEADYLTRNYAFSKQSKQIVEDFGVPWRAPSNLESMRSLQVVTRTENDSEESLDGTFCPKVKRKKVFTNRNKIGFSNHRKRSLGNAKTPKKQRPNKNKKTKVNFSQMLSESLQLREPEKQKSPEKQESPVRGHSTNLREFVPSNTTPEEEQDDESTINGNLRPREVPGSPVENRVEETIDSFLPVVATKQPNRNKTNNKVKTQNVDVKNKEHNDEKDNLEDQNNKTIKEKIKVQDVQIVQGPSKRNERNDEKEKNIEDQNKENELLSSSRYSLRLRHKETQPKKNKTPINSKKKKTLNKTKTKESMVSEQDSGASQLQVTSTNKRNNGVLNIKTNENRKLVVVLDNKKKENNTFIEDTTIKKKSDVSATQRDDVKNDDASANSKKKRRKYPRNHQVQPVECVFDITNLPSATINQEDDAIYKIDECPPPNNKAQNKKKKPPNKKQIVASDDAKLVTVATTPIQQDDAISDTNDVASLSSIRNSCKQKTTKTKSPNKKQQAANQLVESNANVSSDGLRRSGRTRTQALSKCARYFHNIGYEFAMPEPTKAPPKKRSVSSSRQHTKTLMEATLPPIEEVDEEVSKPKKLISGRVEKRKTKKVTDKKLVAAAKMSLSNDEISEDMTLVSHVSTGHMIQWAFSNPEFTALSESPHICIALTGSSSQGRYSSGLLRIDPGKTKQRQLTQNHDMIFCITQGNAEVGVEDKHVVLKAPNMFLVPKGHRYYIKNLNKKKHVVLSFTRVALDEGGG